MSTALDPPVILSASSTPKDVLIRARWTLDHFGWYQGALFGPNGECCLAGAVVSACHVSNRKIVDEALDIMLEHIKTKLPKHFSEPITKIGHFNDRRLRSKAEALAFLDEIIESLP